MTIVETIKSRTSCRTYSDEQVEIEKLSELQNFLISNKAAPFGSNVRFQLLNLDEREIGNIKNLGTYGVIRGARQFIVGAVKKYPMAMEDYGYCMEMNILKATALGLGTCLLGGTFNRSGFAQRINLKEDELLPVISPVGYAGDKKTIIDKTFRWIAGSGKRKPWDDLFYDGNMAKHLTRESVESYETPLECVRLSPSASNKQPWRIIKDNNRAIFHFYLRRTPGYDKLFKEIKLQNVDMGIAMCHFALSVNEFGLPGNWKVNNPQISTDDMEYIASWLTDS